ncbi:YchE family NAAT transporter [Thiomicrorhabdus sp. ZW0627]|uniref:YchE family NAAT transporter n=1 Tax=Thiomicrorhabdus sp. ZW0627 TaxID=3039774 RepID=UPI0024373AD0|nr:YchE family NAAT transporter [Thiomicrorhabdus sp. ZW0627]MDG6773877.1 YchE family NAAT transporter [Thiomicrorhabdus sp. ZW0627]
MLDYADYFKIFIGLLAIVNPIGAIPLFISMTADETEKERQVTINLVAIGFISILLVSLFFGEALLKFFGITIDSFRVGGGILILLMAIAMLHGKTSPARQTPEEADESEQKESVAIVPLAMPLLAGPGAISTVILAAHKSTAFGHYLVIAFGIVLLGIIIWASLRMAPWITDHSSTTGLNIFSRIMGLILAAIAVEFIANGLRGLFPILAQ